MTKIKYPEIKNRELHRIVVTAIIYKKANGEYRYLITQRALDKKIWSGRWTVPGGGLEIDDYVSTKPTTKNSIWYFALANSLRREVKEETGLEIGSITYLLDLAFIRPDRIPVLTLSFYSLWKRGVVKLDPESIDYTWITAKETEKYDLIEGIREEIQMVDLILHGRDPQKVKFEK